jgi:hypothetical protein
MASAGERHEFSRQTRLEELLTAPEGARSFTLDTLRTGPATVSGPSLVRAT